MYHPYRGHRAAQKRVVRRALILVLSFFILACLLFLLFFQNKATIRLFGHELALPWAHSQSAEGDAPPDEPMNFEIVADDTKKPAATPAAPPAAPVAPKMLTLSAEKAADSAYVAQAVQLAAKGVNAAAITVKDASGAVAAASTLKPALDALHGAGMTVAAVLYAYEDDAFARQNELAALQNITGVPWRTAESHRWLDPAADAADAYLRTLVQTCKDAGFDEVIFRSFGWPAAGRLDRIAYGSCTTGALRAELLRTRLAAFAAAAAPMQVSVTVDDPTAANGLSEPSGQDLATLYAASARTYVPMAVQTETSGDSIRTIVGRVTGDNAAKLVPVYTNAALAPQLFAGAQAVCFVPAETEPALTALLP